MSHLRYLHAVKRYGDIVVVMLSSDERVLTRKGSDRPIIPEQDRLELVGALKDVVYAFIDPSTIPLAESDTVHAEIIN